MHGYKWTWIHHIRGKFVTEDLTKFPTKTKLRTFNKTEGLFSFTFQKMRTVCKQQTSTKLHKTDRLISVMINISASRKHLCTWIWLDIKDGFSSGERQSPTSAKGCWSWNYKITWWGREVCRWQFQFSETAAHLFEVWTWPTSHD